MLCSRAYTFIFICMHVCVFILVLVELPLGFQSHSRISSLCVCAHAPFVYKSSVYTFLPGAAGDELCLRHRGRPAAGQHAQGRMHSSTAVCICACFEHRGPQCLLTLTRSTSPPPPPPPPPPPLGRFPPPFFALVFFFFFPFGRGWGFFFFFFTELELE